MKRALVIAAGVVLILALGGAAVAATSQARTIRLNNPGALRKSNSAWIGKIPTTDKDLEAFDTAINGARAMLINMRTQYNRGNNTIRKMTQTWSGGENAGNYAKTVAAKLSMDADATFPFNINYAVALAKAMSDWETGVGYFPTQLFIDAWSRM